MKSMSAKLAKARAEIKMLRAQIRWERAEVERLGKIQMKLAEALENAQAAIKNKEAT